MVTGGACCLCTPVLLNLKQYWSREPASCVCLCWDCCQGSRHHCWAGCRRLPLPRDPDQRLAGSLKCRLGLTRSSAGPRDSWLVHTPSSLRFGRSTLTAPSQFGEFRGAQKGVDLASGGWRPYQIVSHEGGSVSSPVVVRSGTMEALPHSLAQVVTGSGRPGSVGLGP